MEMMEFNKQQDRVHQTLSEAIATLCKNMLHFQSGITVTGLLGITVDKKNVILVNILEQVTGPGYGLDPETFEDIKEFEGLGDSTILEKVFPKDWNSDIYNETALPETTAYNRVVDHLPVKEEPSMPVPIHQDQNMVNTKLEMNGTIPKQVHHAGTRLSTLSSNEIHRGKNLSMKLLGTKDALFSIEQDLTTLDDMSTHISSQVKPDQNDQMTSSCLKGSVGDLFQKDFMSVKEESDSVSTSFINTCPGVLGGSNSMCDMMDNEFGETSSQIVDGKFPCEQCGLVLAHKRSLKRHQQQHKAQDLIWRCDMCPQVFNRKDILQRHIKKHHSSKELNCPICVKKFSRHDSMRRHMVMYHTSAAEQETLKQYEIVT